MRISGVSSVSSVSRAYYAGGLSQSASRKLEGVQKLFGGGSIIQDILDIKELLDLPKIEPVHKLTPLKSPFKRVEAEDDEESQDQSPFGEDESMSRPYSRQFASDNSSENEKSGNYYAVQKAISAYFASSALSTASKGAVPGAIMNFSV